MRALIISLFLVGCGSGTAQLSAETARASACQAVEQVIEDRHDNGDIELDEASRQIDCVRLVCDELHERLVADQGGEE